MNTEVGIPATFKVEIFIDEGPNESPREWENVSVFMFRDHPRYTMPQEEWDDELSDTPEDVCYWTRVIMLDHGRQVFMTELEASKYIAGMHWDMSYVGIAAVSWNKAREVWGDMPEEKLAALAMQAVKDELEDYTAWANGEIYGYVVKNEETDEVVDSCGGFYGWEHAKEDGEAVVDYLETTLHAAARVFAKVADIEDVEKATEARLIEWDIDTEGYYPVPTDRYLELTDAYNQEELPF